MQTYREQLIVQGIWPDDDPRDPETDETAAGELREWIEKQFAPFVKFDITASPSGDASTSYFRPHILINDGGPLRQEPLYTGNSLAELDTEGKAICACALVVRAYLKRRPELAAGR